MYKCIDCGSERGKNKTGKKGDRCIKCHKIYLLEKSRNGNTRYVKVSGTSEHRLIAEQKIGRKLKKGEIVHHINGNKKDNRPENLEVMLSSDHLRLHNTKHIGCEVEGCENKHFSLCLCAKHYIKYKRYEKNNFTNVRDFALCDCMLRKTTK